ncbi:MAG: molybdenum cofactor biosynthesis protein MoaE [Candidatus Nanopelagicales bacterium]
MDRVRLAAMSTTTLTVEEMERVVADPSAGALVSFGGVVRDHDHGREVESLDYEAHPTAERVLQEIAAEVAARHDLVALAVGHRSGPLKVGDAALVAAVSSHHRREAFAACADLVDTVKERLPVWKHQRFADGTEEWVNCA